MHRMFSCFCLIKLPTLASSALADFATCYLQLLSVDKEIAALDLNAAMLQDNIGDKHGALNTDERCILLDGRINMPQPPPSSVASVSGILTYPG